jgi:hypothetical protein
VPFASCCTLAITTVSERATAKPHPGDGWLGKDIAQHCTVASVWSLLLSTMINTHAQNNEWGTQLSTYRDDRIMGPTCRMRYIAEHPTTRLASLHSNEEMVAPVWGKVSKSVW